MVALTPLFKEFIIIVSFFSDQYFFLFNFIFIVLFVTDDFILFRIALFYFIFIYSILFHASLFIP